MNAVKEIKSLILKLLKIEKLFSVLFPNDTTTYSHEPQNFGTETSREHITSYVEVKCLRLWNYEVMYGYMAILCT